MHTVDVLPTLIAAMGGDAAELAAAGSAVGGESSHHGASSHRTCCEQAGSELDGVSQWPMLSRGAAGARQTVLLEADPLASPYSNRPPGFVCSGDQHATPYYALRQGRWKLLLGDPGADDNRHRSTTVPNPSPYHHGTRTLGADDNRHRSIGNGFWCTGRPS